MITYDYTMVKSADEVEFSTLAAIGDYTNPDKYTKSSPEDIAKIERLLDVRMGTLSSDEYYLQKVECQCGRLLTFYDFVFTALVDASHPKSFVLHVLTGTKKIINDARIVRCSNCAQQTGYKIMYGMPSSYLCRDPIGI